MKHEYNSLSLFEHLSPGTKMEGIECKDPKMLSIINDALDGLDERKQFIIEKRFLFEPSMTLRELGEQFGISHERVRQLEDRAKRKIKYNYRKKSIKEKLEALI